MSIQIDEIRKELTSLKCIVCKRYLSVPPIYYTPSGEYRCGRCSFVKENLSFRAELFEKMALCVTFPCIYKDCDAEISWNSVADHEASCPKRMIDCPFDCVAQVDVHDLVQHFNSVHENLKFTKRNLAAESVLKVEEKLKLFYVVSEGEPFVIMFIPGSGEFKFGGAAMPNPINNTTTNSATTNLDSANVNLSPNVKRTNHSGARRAVPTTTTSSSAFYYPTTTTGNTFPWTTGTAAEQPKGFGTNIPAGSSSIFWTVPKTTASAPTFGSLTNSIFSGASTTFVTNSTQSASSNVIQTPSIPKQSGLSVFSLFPTKPYTSFTLTFISDNWKVDIRDQTVEPFISKDHCRKCWFDSCLNDLHKPYAIHVDLNKYVTTKFKSSTLSRLFQSDNVTFSITIHNKPIVDEKEKGPFVELSRNVQRSLECPICNNIMVPPITLCVTGHAICTICKSFLKECPTCKAAYMGTRSFALEELYENSRLMCSMSNEGNNCEFTGDADEMSRHDKYHDAQ